MEAASTREAPGYVTVAGVGFTAQIDVGLYGKRPSQSESGKHYEMTGDKSMRALNSELDAIKRGHGLGVAVLVRDRWMLTSLFAGSIADLQRLQRHFLARTRHHDR